MVSQSDITYRLREIPDHYGINEVSQLIARLLELDVDAISVRSLATHPFREMEKVATLNIRERPKRLANGANEWKFKCCRKLHGDDLDIVIDTNFIGITPLHGISDEQCDTWYAHLHCDEVTQTSVIFTDDDEVVLLFLASTRTLLDHSKPGQTTSCGSATHCRGICQIAEYTFTAMIPAWSTACPDKLSWISVYTLPRISKAS